MAQRQNHHSGSPWEDRVGYSRAVRVGNIIEVSGTTAYVDGKLVGEHDLYAQCKCIFEKIEAALKACDAGLEHVVRTRTFTTRIGEWEAFARAHAETFGNIRPTASLIGVSAFIEPDMLVEIEVTAIVPGE